MVFQQPNPFPLSIADNLRFPLREHGVSNRDERERRTEEALRAVGLWEEVKGRLGANRRRRPRVASNSACLSRERSRSAPSSSTSPAAPSTPSPLVSSSRSSPVSRAATRSCS